MQKSTETQNHWNSSAKEVRKLMFDKDIVRPYRILIRLQQSFNRRNFYVSYIKTAAKFHRIRKRVN